MPLLLGKETVMGQELVFNYKKSFCFLFFGAGSVFLAAFLMAPMILCSCYWNWQWFVHWWYLYIFPNVMGLILLVFGISNLSFWFFHIRKKPYLVITDDTIKIDAETDIKINDIAATAFKSFLGCKMLCLEIKNPQEYKFSWRFKADRLFHKKYHAFICPELIKDDQRGACLDWFNARYLQN